MKEKGLEAEAFGLRFCIFQCLLVIFVLLNFQNIPQQEVLVFQTKL
jgi:hypothetical protein